MKLHIVYVVSPGGGPEAFIKTLLPWLERQGHRVSIVYTRRDVDEAHCFPPRIHVEFAPPGPAHYYFGKLVGSMHLWPRRLRAWENALTIMQAVLRIDRLHPVDIVEVTEGHIVTLLKLRWKTVLRAHGSDWSFRHFCQDKVSTWDSYLIRQQAAQMKKTDAVSAISQHLADHLSEFCQFSRDQIVVIPYSIDAAIFTPKGPVANLRGNPVLLSIGRLEHRKGTDILLKAMSTILERYSEATLYLLGNESQYTYNQLLSFLPPERRKSVIFTGFVPHERLPEYYRAATLYITPTQYETFGYTLLEAMACGKPVVSCNVGAVPELVQDGIQGFLLPFDDPFALAYKVIELLSQPALIQNLGYAARKKAMLYKLEEVNPRIEQLYQSIQKSRSA